MDNDKLATSDDDIIREARERMRLASDSESSNRSEAETALKFRNGEQWPDEIQNDRTKDARPCLTINLTDAVVRRVENACRENRPRIKIDPVGDGADVETARILNGLTRHVEAISGADYAYDCATSSAITGGWGWISVTNDYADEKSFDQELMIVPHRNPFKIYADPAAEMPDGSDLTWLIESEMLKRTDYREQYGHLDDSGWTFVGTGDDLSDWSHKEEIRVAKYWRVENKKDTLVLLSDGRSLFKSELPKDPAVMQYQQVSIVKERPTVRRVVCCYLMTAFKILKRWEWPGRWIPYVPVYGRELDINGRVKRKGMVKDLMDPARMYNFSETAKTEVYALQPKAPWLMPEGSMEGHEGAWRDTNRKPVVALEYKQMYGSDGQPLPPPQRQEPPPLGTGFQEWSQTSQSNFMAVAGMPHDPNQDAKGEVVSGVAIKRRQGLSDISHFDFYDNLTRSLRQLGRILVGLYPHFYSTSRMQRIVREDGTSEMVGINQPTQGQDEQGQPYLYIKNNLSVGRYDVVVDTGPGYQTKREESTEAKLELLATPLGEMVGAHAGDLVIRGMDFENSDEIADRLQASIPGAITDKSLKDMPPKAKALIGGLQAQLQQAQQQLQAAGLEIKFKHGIEKMKQDGETERLQIKERNENAREAAALHTKVHDVNTKAHVQVHDTHVKATTAMNVAEIQVAGKMLDSHNDRAHEREMGERELEHAEKMTDQQMKHESTEGAKDRAASKKTPE